MRKIEIEKTTWNSFTFKRVYLNSKISCPICPPNKGCNKKSGRDSRKKNWKLFRDTQYKQL